IVTWSPSGCRSKATIGPSALAVCRDPPVPMKSTRRRNRPGPVMLWTRTDARIAMERLLAGLPWLSTLRIPKQPNHGSLRIGLPRPVLALRGDLPGIRRVDDLLQRDDRQVVGQRLQEEVLVLDGHRRPDMHLDRQDAVELPPLLVQVDHVNRRMSVDPMPVMVPFRHDPVVVPFARSERLERELPDHPGLTLRVDDDLLAPVG